VEVDLHQLGLRHRDLRIRHDEQRRRRLGPVAEIGQQVPVVVIPNVQSRGATSAATAGNPLWYPPREPCILAACTTRPSAPRAEP
jgi:hypothetical protein